MASIRNGISKKYSREYGFEREHEIQDFPIREKAVLLHIRRRKWRDREADSIFTYDYDLAEQGSKPSPESIAFF